MIGKDIEVASSGNGKIRQNIVDYVKDDEMSETIRRKITWYEKEDFSAFNKHEFWSIADVFWTS